MPDHIDWRRSGAPGDRTMMALERDTGASGAVDRAPDALDTPEAVSLHRSLQGHYLRELERQRDWRRDMELDEDIYDGARHWSAEDAGVLRARGQMPLVYNVTANAVDWLLGSQRRNPTDYSILPRTERGREHAEKKSQLLKYLRDIGDGSMMDSRAFAEAVKAGLSWLECGGQGEEDGEPVYERMESWRNIIHDSVATEMDLSDGRYIFRVKWVDLDRAVALFPARKVPLIQSCEDILGLPSSGGPDAMSDSAMDSRERNDNYEAVLFQSGRRRVRLYEGWYRRPMAFDMMRGGEFSGEIYEPGSDRHEWSLANQKSATVAQVVKERVMVAIQCDAGLLWSGPSPYRHNRFPFTPVWGRRRASDGAPYGFIRRVRDIQIDLNKRASKALWHATARSAWVPKGSVDDLEQFREEMHRPDAVHVYDAMKGRPEIDSDLQHAATQADMMERNIQLIERTGGVTSENMGQVSPSVRSGKAIIAIQDQGQLATSDFFENLRYAKRKHGEKLLACVEQFYTAEKVFRITNERGNPEYVGINTEDPSVDDFIAMSRADFIVAEEDYHATHRQANADKLIELMGMLAGASPQTVLGILDLLIESMDVPKGGEIVKRIRQATGIPDPDADPNNPDPETEAMMAAKADQEEMAKRAAEAEIAEKEGKAAQAMAQAEKTSIEALRAQGAMEGEELQKMGQAVSTAIQIAGLPAVARAAEVILEEARARVAAGAAPSQPAPALAPVAAATPPVPQTESTPEGANL